jgi:signal transduction histidine kinase
VQLQQVLLNLVVNACDAMASCNTPERRVLIHSGVENGSSAVIISVTDRGSSIPEDKMEQIFEPFFTTKAKGMGLGLSVCRTIITAHRGELWATNNPDCGATFHFSLPVAAANEGASMNNISQLTGRQCCSHGAVRRRGGVDPNGINAPQARGYNRTEQS